MRRLFYFLMPLPVILLIVLFNGCNSDSKHSTVPDIETGSWAIYTPYDWSHDGKPFHSVYCTIYSDAASDFMKQQMGDIADESFSFIMQLFNFHDLSAFIYPPGFSKIDIYMNINHTENINWAYWAGFIITIRSTEINEQWRDYTVYTATHELIHQLEFLIEGSEELGSDFWFREGVAVHVGCLRSTAFNKIESVNELNAWIDENQNIPGQGNPITIHQYSDFPEGADMHQYYRLFELAIRYILDERGCGQSFHDIMKLFFDLRQETSFIDALENHLEIDLVDYEKTFFDRMRQYLNFIISE